MPEMLLLSEKTLTMAVHREMEGGCPVAARLLAEELLAAVPRDAETLHLRGLIENTGREILPRPRIGLRERWHSVLTGQNGVSNSRWRAPPRATGAVCCGFACDKLSDDPADTNARYGYGRALLELGQYDESIPLLRDCLVARPDSVLILVSLARALTCVKEFKQAADLLFRARELSPANDEPPRLLARLCEECAKFQLAISCWEHVLSLSPDDAEALAGLTKSCWQLGRTEETLTYAGRLIATGYAPVSLCCFRLHCRLFGPCETAAEFRAAAEEFGRSITSARSQGFSRTIEDRQPGRLRIGYVCGEFNHGPAFYFLYPLLAAHDHTSDFEVFLYHTRNHIDYRTELFRNTGTWRDCRVLDDSDIRGLIQQDRIDILVDLSGFLPDNRLTIFAGRAAPVQAAYPNCPSTTGVAAMDYIFTDRWTCPPGQENQYSEQPMMLPSGYLAFLPPEVSPPFTPLPALTNGFITFGIFQRRIKMHAAFWDLAAEIVRSCPGSRLLIQNGNQTTDHPDSPARKELLSEFVNRGVSSERITLVGLRSHAEAMAYMTQADIALDTFPFQGQTTTCECLWSGVPVIALSGHLHVARVGSAILQRVGLGSLVTETPRQYVLRALELASDVTSLAALRAGMRQRLQNSTLLDGQNLAREVEDAYRKMWETRCKEHTASRASNTGRTSGIPSECLR